MFVPLGLGAIGQPRSPVVTTVPYSGVPVTVGRMQRLVRLSLEFEQSAPLRRLVEDVLSRTRPKDPVSECAAIYYFLLVNMRYMLDPVHVELVKSPLMSLAKTPADVAAGRRANQGDCDEVSAAMAAMQMTAGKRASFITCTTDAARDDHHVFTLTRIPMGGPQDYRVVTDPVVGPYATDLLRRVVRFREWPIEPVRLPNGGWGVGSGPVQYGRPPWGSL